MKARRTPPVAPGGREGAGGRRTGWPDHGPAAGRGWQADRPRAGCLGPRPTGPRGLHGWGGLVPSLKLIEARTAKLEAPHKADALAAQPKENGHLLADVSDRIAAGPSSDSEATAAALRASSAARDREAGKAIVWLINRERQQRGYRSRGAKIMADQVQLLAIAH